MELTDIASLEKWMELEDTFFNAYGLETNVFNTDGIRITDNKRWVNRLCPAIKATDKGQAFICAVAHMNLAGMAKNQQDAVIEECDAGLVKIVVPIFLKDEFVGAVGACGFLLDDGEADSFMINKTTGIDEEKVEELASDLSVIDTPTAEEMVEKVKAHIDGLLASAA